MLHLWTYGGLLLSTVSSTFIRGKGRSKKKCQETWCIFYFSYRKKAKKYTFEGRIKSCLFFSPSKLTHHVFLLQLSNRLTYTGVLLLLSLFTWHHFDQCPLCCSCYSCCCCCCTCCCCCYMYECMFLSSCLLVLNLFFSLQTRLLSFTFT